VRLSAWCGPGSGAGGSPTAARAEIAVVHFRDHREREPAAASRMPASARIASEKFCGSSIHWLLTEATTGIEPVFTALQAAA
jgi:hypothetical protein